MQIEPGSSDVVCPFVEVADQKSDLVHLIAIAGIGGYKASGTSPEPEG